MEVGARELDARQGAAGLAKVGNNLLNLGSLGFSLGNIGDFVSGLFSREELEAMVARDLEERQGLAGLAKVGNNLLNLGSLGFSLGNIGDFVGGLLGREVDEVMMREIIEQEIYRRAVADLD
ncbi:hypothetical protein DL96DRAFT_1812453 [Flagelloscypha sp. PMI_526]|nr:hypothetical protein DL96DRAFT_1812453 [Flagelloscypha sp. PMI_526]